MNIIQQQDQLKSLPDQALQTELLRPTGSMPSYLVLSELQRRKDMRAQYAGMQRAPNTSMADEFSKGMGSADVGQYPAAVRGAMPDAPTSPGDAPSSPMGGEPQPMPQQGGPPPPQQPQGFASGGVISETFDPTMNPLDDPASINGPGMGLSSMGGLRNGMRGNIPGPFGLQIPMSYFDFGSANGATGTGTGEGIGSASAGVAGTGPGEGATGGVGGDDGGTYSRGGRVRYADGGSVDIPEWMWPSTKRFKEAMSRRSPDAAELSANALRSLIAAGRADTPPDIGPAPDVSATQPMPSNLFTRDPGMSYGQTLSNRMMGRNTLGIPSGASETGGQPMMTQGLGSVIPDVQETGGPPEPMRSGGSGYGGPDPMFNPQGSPNAQATMGSVPGMDPTSIPPGGGGNPGAPSGGGGGPAGPARGGVGSALNIGGEGLAEYIDQVRSLQMPDRFGEMERRNAEDRAELRGGRESDKGLALLAAAGATLQGRSPYGLQNIGAGVTEGVKNWSDASKEMRRAERDIRTAENQITIAKANRDEKQLDSGMKLYENAQVKKMQAEEIRQRSLDRLSVAGTAAADRAANRELKQKEIESLAEDRKLHREQTEITNYGSMAERYERDATAAARAYSAQAAILGDVTKTAGMSEQDKAAAAAELEKTKTQRDFLGYQANQYRSLHEKVLNTSTARRQGIPTAGDKRGETADGRKLKNGERFITKDGQFGVWREE